jgi:polyisoprenoid-binding protein YceI
LTRGSHFFTYVNGTEANRAYIGSKISIQKHNEGTIHMTTTKTMKRMVLPALAGVAVSASSPAQTSWMADNAHSNVKFAVTHLLISEVEGDFRVYRGSMQTGKDQLEDALIDFTVDVASVNTNNEQRDAHLRSDDFFNADMYPQMTFKSVSWKRVDNQRYELIGDLTIRDITKRVSFNVIYAGKTQDSYGNTIAAFRVSAKIDRFDFGLKWNALTEMGGAVVGKEVTITLNLQFTKQRTS